MKRFKLSELSYKDKEYWIHNSIKADFLTVDNPVMYQDYLIFDDAAGWGGKFAFVHKDYDGAPDAKDGRHGHASSVMDCIKKINRYILENEVEL